LGLHCQEILRDTGGLGVQICWVDGHRVIDQPAGANDDEEDDDKQ
jgi:hypothetical protein